MKNETQTLIIDTASALFYEKGYNLTGINEIIAKAGIAKATLYSHFKSKEDLCIAYLAAKDKELLSNIKNFCNKPPQGDDRLLAVMEFLLPFFQSDGFNGCWCIRTVAEIPQNNIKIKNQIRKGKEAFMNFISTLVKENRTKLSTKRQGKLAKRIYLLYEGAISESHLQDKAWPIQENLELLKEQLEQFR